MRGTVHLLVGIAAITVSCTLLNNTDGIAEGPAPQGGNAGSLAEASVDANPSVDSTTDPGSSCSGCGTLEECYQGVRCVAAMVALPSGFSIDATEVTRSQYESWIATGPSAEGQAEDCSWNNSFAPDESCLQGAEVCTSDCKNHPQPCVDWCDAKAYCAASGKRLCGKIGGGSLIGNSTEKSDPAMGQWINACSCGKGESRPYPYGTYEGQACNGWDQAQTGCSSGSCTTQPVAAMANCTAPAAPDPLSGYRGVYDLSGNVWEWEDACWETSPTPRCQQRGGSYKSQQNSLTCDYTRNSGLNDRTTREPDIGFRCCSL